jgi:hypothetical protein
MGCYVEWDGVDVWGGRGMGVGVGWGRRVCQMVVWGVGVCGGVGLLDAGVEGRSVGWEGCTLWVRTLGMRRHGHEKALLFGVDADGCVWWDGHVGWEC